MITVGYFTVLSAIMRSQSEAVLTRDGKLKYSLQFAEPQRQRQGNARRRSAGEGTHKYLRHEKVFQVFTFDILLDEACEQEACCASEAARPACSDTRNFCCAASAALLDHVATFPRESVTSCFFFNFFF